MKIPLILFLFAALSAPANTLTVTNTADSGPGSLRDAIAASAAADTIAFDPGVIGTITLTNGALSITNDLSIIGPGAALLKISGNGNSSIFQIPLNSPAPFVAVSGLTIADGFDNVFGGAISFFGKLAVTSCVISNNSSTGFGGGIFAAGTLTLSNCTFVNNSGVAGGAVFFQPTAGSGTIRDSLFVNNVASSNSFGGGAICVIGAPTTTSSVALTNCTISGNSAGVGGGVCVLLHNGFAPTLVLSACTICSNACATGASGVGGGGICITNGTVLIQNSIIARNHSSALGQDISVRSPGVLASQGYNLIGATNDSNGWIASDLLGSTNTPLDPLLGPLQNNGGPTWTHALLPGSPAIDGGLGGAAALDQQQLNGPFLTGGPDTWQSFTAGVSGALTKIEIGHWSTPSGSNAPGTLSIYAGEGTSGNLLATTSVTFLNTVGNQSFLIPSAPKVKAGHQYTFRVTIPGAPSIAWVLMDNSNPYGGGRAESGPTYDYVFKTYVVPHTKDQRGFPRPYDLPSVANAIGGDGSDIGAFELLIPPTLSVAGDGNSVVVSWPDMTVFTLQQNGNFDNAAGWTTSGYFITTTNGTNSITIAPPIGNLFFRLRSP